MRRRSDQVPNGASEDVVEAGTTGTSDLLSKGPADAIHPTAAAAGEPGRSATLTTDSAGAAVRAGDCAGEPSKLVDIGANPDDEVVQEEERDARPEEEEEVAAAAAGEGGEEEGSVEEMAEEEEMALEEEEDVAAEVHDQASVSRMREELRRTEEETQSLQEQQRKLARDAEQVSDEMYAEAKRLLTLFGVPYLDAPTEAEAQCAQLEQASLVDGVVTEDNDALLFGARRVYRHLFDSNRHLEVYCMDDVEAELNLTRQGLVALAQLLGSDYTDGVHGVGIVNAMETIAAYGADADGLRAFATWVRAWRDQSSDASGAADEPGDDEERNRRARQQAYERKHSTVKLARL